uniref:uncharacterized protein LOC104265827 n=1 Tax=Ciona intestinalis TaxID=7719 RepID=UPI00089DB759|nr:uncharacterized protein LOC104265827 [Ciona intestinalis]|eukprot:XP_009859017.2 uncharacterized protein LOC104265827 [Ciona intestinalis]
MYAGIRNMMTVLWLLNIFMMVECKTTKKVYPFTYTDCALRSRLMLKISPNPPSFNKHFNYTLKAFASHDYNVLIYHVDVWGGVAPGKTTRFLAASGYLCNLSKLICKGHIGDVLESSETRILHHKSWPFTFFNASVTLENEHGEKEICFSFETSIVES